MAERLRLKGERLWIVSERYRSNFKVLPSCYSLRRYMMGSAALNRGRPGSLAELDLSDDRILRSVLEDWVKDQQRIWHELRPVIEARIRPRRILDVGSAAGQCCFVLSRVWPEAEVVGCEVETEAVEVAKLLCGERCEFVVVAAEELPERYGAFDLINCANVIEHCFSPERLVRRCARALRPGGVWLLFGPNYLFPYEHHLCCWMLPFGPRPLLRLIARAKRLDPQFVDHLQLRVNAITVRVWLRRCGMRWEDLGRLKAAEILLGKRESLFAPRLVRVLKAAKLNNLALQVVQFAPWCLPSINLLVTKPVSCPESS